MTAQARNTVADIVDRLDLLTADAQVSLRDIVLAFGDASFLSILLVPALLVVSPLSGIPVLSSICGLTIAIISLQMMVGRHHLWLPDFLMRRRLSGPVLHRAAGRLRRVAQWLDRASRPRMGLLFRAPLVIVPQMACVLSGLAMPFLELVPFSSSLLGAAVTAVAVGFIARDGLFLVGGAVFVGLAALVPVLVAGQLA